MGDFGSATEAMRIIDLFALQIFAKKSGRCNFRLLQHYRHVSALTNGLTMSVLEGKADLPVASPDFSV